MYVSIFFFLFRWEFKKLHLKPHIRLEFSKHLFLHIYIYIYTETGTILVKLIWPPSIGIYRYFVLMSTCSLFLFRI